MWLTPDSVVPDVNNPIAWNPYAFNYQNPVQYVDPSGHNPLLLFAAIGAVGGAGLYALTTPSDQWTLGGFAEAGLWGASAGLTVYMLPGLVGYGMTLAGTDMIGTAVWLNRVGVPATRLFGLMQAGLATYEWGHFLQYGGWAIVASLFRPQYLGITQVQMQQMGELADEVGDRVIITGRQGETALGQARRWYARRFYGKWAEVTRFGMPWWRNTGVSTGDSEVDIWMRFARFSPEAEAWIKNVFGVARLDYYNEFWEWNFEEPPGLIFEPGGIVKPNLFPWQEP